jgi:hypothetical protein
MSVHTLWAANLAAGRDVPRSVAGTAADHFSFKTNNAIYAISALYEFYAINAVMIC